MIIDKVQVPAFYPDVEGYQHAFESVFALNGVLLFGSMTAYAVAQLTDNRLYHFWKRVTKGKHLWLRNNASTWVSQLVDTIIVNSILALLMFKLAYGLSVGAGVIAFVLLNIQAGVGYALLLLIDATLRSIGNTTF